MVPNSTEQILQLTHKKWIFCNDHVHYKKLDGFTMAQHEGILAKVDKLMRTDPSDLLDKLLICYTLLFTNLPGIMLGIASIGLLLWTLP